ncbi:MAG: recombination protein O N-terminal domain-containing protein, partial [Sphingomonadaceae bacterium]
MNIRTRGIVVATRPHGETAVILRLLSETSGLVAAYLAGGRGRHMRPVIIPGNLVDTQLHSRNENQLPYARLELLTSRAPWLGEP